MDRVVGLLNCRRLALVAVVLAALVVVLAGCGSSTAAGTPGSVRVVAAENFWGDIAAQIGGRYTTVTSIISNPNTDPHLYTSNAANAAAVAQAQVVIENGVGYDTFMSQLLGASGAHPVVVSAQQVMGVTGANANPHLWYDIPRVPAMAAAIEQAITRADPAHKAAFQANLARFEKSLAPLQALIAKIKAKYTGVPVAYTERVAGYLLADAGLNVVSPPGFAAAIENGNEPAPADVQAMDALLTGRKVRVLLYNVQTVSATTQQVRALAQQYGIPVVGVSETMPPSQGSYQAWQLHQAQAILRALGG
jgi:zinc/manganese transport system substrate-binding protein